MDYEKMVKKMAKVLVKEFKERKGSYIPIKNSLTWVWCKKDGYYFGYDDAKLNLYFGDLDERGVAQVTRDVAREVEGLLKLPKKTLMKRREETCYGGNWYSGSFTLVKGIAVITPCKDFFAINKKLVKMGLKPIDFTEWTCDEVAGKRERIFSRHSNYYCKSEKKCAEVLAYLKGKKKLSYDIEEIEYCEDREYGIEHETEWYGSICYALSFTDSKGKVAKFY